MTNAPPMTKEKTPAENPLPLFPSSLVGHWWGIRHLSPSHSRAAGYFPSSNLTSSSVDSVPEMTYTSLTGPGALGSLENHWRMVALVPAISKFSPSTRTASNSPAGTFTLTDSSLTLNVPLSGWVPILDSTGQAASFLIGNWMTLTAGSI